jgi:hypothetical protein
VGERVDVNIGEEMGILPSSLIYTIVIPTLILAHTLLFGISSRPVDKNSPMFRLMDKKWPETGKPIIKTVVFTNLCDICRVRGLQNCNHAAEDPWSNQQQNRKIQLLMSDKQSDWRREMRNEDVEDESEPAFSHDSVMFLGESKFEYSGNEEQYYAYISVDPAAGGAKSKYAIVSMIMPLVYHKKTDTRREQVVVRILFSFIVPCHPAVPSHPPRRQQS